MLPPGKFTRYIVHKQIIIDKIYYYHYYYYVLPVTFCIVLVIIDPYINLYCTHLLDRHICAWCVCVDQRFTEGHNSRFDSQKNRQYLSKALDVTVQ